MENIWVEIIVVCIDGFPERISEATPSAVARL